jgi:hypothetical protein
MPESQVLQRGLSAHALAGPQGELRGGGGGGERRRREYGACGRPCGHAGGTVGTLIQAARGGDVAELRRLRPRG